MGRNGSLSVVGSGIQFGEQLTPQARARIQDAEKVLFLAGDAVTTALVRKLNAGAESLSNCYRLGKSRMTTYNEMVDCILRYVRSGKRVCVVDYGHPGLLDYPAHRAIELAEQEGYAAEMLPAISAVDCLFADLHIDPGDEGCQIHDATEFLIRRRRVDTSIPLILLQIAVTGEFTCSDKLPVAGLRGLARMLGKCYGADHRVIIYTAAQYPFAVPQIKGVTLRQLPKARMDPVATLFVPPKRRARFDFAMLKTLGIKPDSRPRRAKR